MHLSVKQTLAALVDVREAHAAAYAALSKARTALKSAQLSCTDAADLSYVCRKMSELLDDGRKEANATTTMADTTACALWTQLSMMNPTDETKSIKAELCSAVPNLGSKILPPHPQKEPESYAKLLRWFGVNDETIQGGLLDVRWKDFQAFAADRMHKGLPMPDGVDIEKSLPNWTLTCRGHKDVDLVEVSEAAKKEVHDKH